MGFKVCRGSVVELEGFLCLFLLYIGEAQFKLTSAAIHPALPASDYTATQLLQDYFKRPDLESSNLLIVVYLVIANEADGSFLEAAFRFIFNACWIDGNCQLVAAVSHGVRIFGVYNFQVLLIILNGDD